MITRFPRLKESLVLTLWMALLLMALPHDARALRLSPTDGGETPLTLDKYSLNIYLNDGNSVQVESGSGSYEIVNMNPEIVETEFISDGIANARRTEPGEEGGPIDDRLFIKGIAIGEAVVRVIDKNTQEMADIDIQVTNAPRLTLASNALTMTAGESATVEILTGSRWYQVTSNSTDIVSAYHYSQSSGRRNQDGETVYEHHEMIRITARTNGYAIVSVKDMSSGEEARISITVNNEGPVAGAEWYLITDREEKFPMSIVSMLVAGDDSPYFSVHDMQGNVLAEDVLKIRFMELDPTGIKDVRTNEPRNMLKSYVSNKLTLTGVQGTVSVYSTAGMKMTSAVAAGEETVVDVSSLPAGTYILSCGKQSFKFNKK